MSQSSPLSKRRRFAPHTLPPVIAASDNTNIEDHTFDSPLLLQLCEQAPTDEEIQTGLLQVGMRVRKAVAEGYKNSPQKKFTPRPFFNMRRLSPETQAALCSGHAHATNELAPFCAGSVQPLSTATFCGISLAALSYSSDDWSSPISEQNLWSYSTSHKRGFEADSDSEESQDWTPETPTLTAEAGAAMPIDYFNIDMEAMSDVSPMTRIGDRLRGAGHGRKVAVPRSRVRSGQVAEPPMPPTAAFNPFANIAMEQREPIFGFTPTRHRRMMSCGMEANLMNDFGEASFLQRREDVEMDCS